MCIIQFYAIQGCAGLKTIRKEIEEKKMSTFYIQYIDSEENVKV